MLRRKVFTCSVLLALVWAAAATPPAHAQTDRIIMVGDSWPYFMWGYDSINMALGNLGLGGEFSCYMGSETLTPGSNAADWAANVTFLLDPYPCLDQVAITLNENPTIDIVHLCIAGNDLMGGGGWHPSLTVAQETALGDTIVGYTETVIDYLLAIRPDVKVAVSGYDYVRHTEGASSIQEVSYANIRFEERRRVMIATKDPDRVTFINNFGVCQNRMGDPVGDPVGVPAPISPSDAPIPPIPPTPPYAAGAVTLPGGPPAYTPWPGGNPDAPGPTASLVDDIHLTMMGYLYVAENCINQVYADWLDFPKCYAIRVQGQNPVDSGIVTFVAEFSEPVNGVTTGDFIVHTTGGTSDALVLAVRGDGTDTIEIDVGTAADSGTIRLELIDDGTIFDLGGKALAGGADGGFLYGETAEVVQMPVAVWPAAWLLLGAGVLALRRRKR